MRRDDLEGEAAALIEMFGLDPNCKNDRGVDLRTRLFVVLDRAFVAGQEDARQGSVTMIVCRDGALRSEHSGPLPEWMVPARRVKVLR